MFGGGRLEENEMRSEATLTYEGKALIVSSAPFPETPHLIGGSSPPPRHTRWWQEIIEHKVKLLLLGLYWIVIVNKKSCTPIGLGLLEAASWCSG